MFIIKKQMNEQMIDQPPLLSHKKPIIGPPPSDVYFESLELT